MRFIISKAATAAEEKLKQKKSVNVQDVIDVVEE